MADVGDECRVSASTRLGRRACLQRIVGSIIHPTMEDGEVTEATKVLYEAGFALLFADDEGKVVYANKAAQLALGVEDWDAAVGKDIAQVLPSLAALGLAEGGSEAGKELAAGEATLLAVTTWDVLSPAGGSLGVAAVWEEWERDGAILSAAVPEPPAAVEAPTDEEMKAAQAAVAEQGDAVRKLKEEGQGNGDPEVAAAVEELLARKAALAALEERAKAAEAAPL